MVPYSNILIGHFGLIWEKKDGRGFQRAGGAVTRDFPRTKIKGNPVLIFFLSIPFKHILQCMYTLSEF